MWSLCENLAFRLCISGVLSVNRNMVLPFEMTELIINLCVLCKDSLSFLGRRYLNQDSICKRGCWGFNPNLVEPNPNGGLKFFYTSDFLTRGWHFLVGSSVPLLSEKSVPCLNLTHMFTVFLSSVAVRLPVNVRYLYR